MSSKYISTSSIILLVFLFERCKNPYKNWMNRAHIRGLCPVVPQVWPPESSGSVFAGYTGYTIQDWSFLWSWYDIYIYIIWYDMIWYDMIWYDMIWYDMIWYDMIWYDMIWYDIWCDVMWCDIWYMIYDIWYMIYDIWYDMIWYDMIWYYHDNIYTVKMEVRMPARIPNFPPPQLECGSRTAKNPSVRMPSHPGFKFFCFWRTLCTNPSLRMPTHYEYHQMLECSWNASPLKLLSTSISATRTLPTWNCFASISAVTMLFPLKWLFTSISSVRTLPPWSCFYTSISAVGMLPPWNCFLPAFHHLERFPVENALPAFQLLECVPLE